MAKHMDALLDDGVEQPSCAKPPSEVVREKVPLPFNQTDVPIGFAVVLHDAPEHEGCCLLPKKLFFQDEHSLLVVGSSES